MTNNETNAVLQHRISRKFDLRIVSRAALGLILAATALPLASTGAQQDLGEAARQARARQQQANPPSHVYTNDDLARPQILTPEDRARYLAARSQDASKPEIVAASNSAPADQPKDSSSTTPDAKTAPLAVASSETAPAPSSSASQNVAPPAVVLPSPEVPLGDVARSYRAQRREDEARATANAAPPVATKNSFPMMVTNIPLATMKLPVGAAPSVAANRINPAATIEFKPRTVPPVVTASAPHPGVPSRHVSSVIVAPGDTMWSLARKYLGSCLRWEKLLKANPNIADPRQLPAGAELVIPSRHD